MAGYTELIKNLDKIKSMVRDFYVFGFKGKSDFDVSPRTYDNERRRIQSYLQEYITESWDKAQKTISISSDTVSKTTNPLFKVWKTKSFTRNDIFLHFVIMDILQNENLPIAKIADIIADEYIGVLAEPAFIDNMTIRNKLNEYVKLGIAKSWLDGKVMYYSLAENTFTPSDAMLCAMSFYQNISVAGFLISPYLEGHSSPFIYKNAFFSHTLDDKIVLELLDAIRGKNVLTINSETKYRKTWAKDVGPIKILANERTGRRYLASYNKRIHKYSNIRIDNIRSIEVTDKHEDNDELVDKYDENIQNSFAITPMKHTMNSLKLVLHIDEEYEKYVLERLRREGMHGTIVRLSANTFEYCIDIPDTMEMVPWLRTFMGRIISIEGTEKATVGQFKRDIKSMAIKYRDDEDV